MTQLRQLLARYWASLWRRRPAGDDDQGSETTTELALLQQRQADNRRWAEQRKHFWAEFHEGQRHAEDRSRSSR